MIPKAEDWLRENFMGWERLGDIVKENIRDFPILWALFELKATNAQATVPTIIQAVERLDHYHERAETEAAVIHFAQRYHVDHLADHRLDQLKLTDNAKARVKPVISGEQVDPKERLIAVLLIIHRLRNNFLHGEKARYGYHDQLDNFQVSNKVLMEVIPLWEGHT